MICYVFLTHVTNKLWHNFAIRDGKKRHNLHLGSPPHPLPLLSFQPETNSFWCFDTSVFSHMYKAHGLRMPLSFSENLDVPMLLSMKDTYLFSSSSWLLVKCSPKQPYQYCTARIKNYLQKVHICIWIIKLLGSWEGKVSKDLIRKLKSICYLMLLWIEKTIIAENI